MIIVYNKHYEEMNMETLNLTGVTESIVRYLRIDIIEGKLLPGQKLNEIELAKQLGVSRPPLREAFRILENEHLVVSLPRKGCYVTEVSIYDCRQIYKVRELIECGTIDCLKANNIKDLPEVTSAFEFAAQRSTTNFNDSRTEAMEYQNPFPLFHINLVASTKNSWLIRFYDKIAPTLARYQFICYVQEQEVLSKVLEEHKQILKLIKKGKYGLAKQMLRAHINWYVDFLEDSIKQKESKEKIMLVDS